ncbi:MAG: IS21-like element helper ATPase IstB [Betaproteobacteria bacterium]|nr:IS21-like element helper ATPase IstB [Betaproteobacteria bacterium]
MNMQILTLQSRFEELGLGFLAAGLESYLEDQSLKDQTLLQSIADLVDLEYLPRKERSSRSRLKLSGLPSLKRLEDFDLSWLKGGLTQKQFEELSSLSFIDRKQNLVLMGPSGLGKTHLMLALAHKACLNGYTAWYTTCLDLMENLSRAREAGRLKRKLVWLRKPHLLVIDEVGYETLTVEQANLFFQVVNARYEHSPIIITTNKPFGKWSEIMTDEAIATATLDRLLHHAHILSLKGDSYRMKDRLKIGVVDPE